MCFRRKKETKQREEDRISLSFYKKNGSWYVDVPEFTEEDTIMVGGIDAFLDRYCRGRHIYPAAEGRVTIRISTRWSGHAPLYLLHKDCTPEEHIYSLYTNGINQFSRAFHDIGGIMLNGYIMDLHISKFPDSIFPEPPECISIF